MTKLKRALITTRAVGKGTINGWLLRKTSGENVILWYQFIPPIGFQVRPDKYVALVKPKGHGKSILTFGSDHHSCALCLAIQELVTNEANSRLWS